MPLEVKKRERENPQSVIRRFTKAVRQSGILMRVKNSMFRKRPKSPLAKKKTALRREQRKKEFEKREKMEKT